ncbi:thioredoxin-like protein, partial [Globomyces pollinis-pini]
ISIIVDFHAPWCGPCRFLGPALEQEVARVKNTVLVKVNVDEAPNVAAKFQVASLPTVMVFRNGKVINSFIGSRDKAFVKKFVEDL